MAARLPESGDQAAAEAQLQAIWRNVRLLGASARATMTLFELGAGDAFVTYEHDALLAQERGAPLEIVVPPRTIVAQHVAVIVDDNVTPGERPVAQAFVDYLLSDAGQQALSRYHLRPADLEGEQFPGIPQPFTVEDLGGWSQAYTEVVEGLWQTEIEPRLDLEPAPRAVGHRRVMMPEMHNPNTTASASPPRTHPVSPGKSRSRSGQLPLRRAWWERVRVGKIGLFVASLYLFMLAITLMKEGARGVAPLVRNLLDVTSAANALGFGWLFAYAIMSGSPVAAAALTFFDAGVVDKLGAFAMITGSRLGASFIVLLIGFLYVLRGRDRATSLSMGLLSLIGHGHDLSAESVAWRCHPRHGDARWATTAFRRASPLGG